MASDDDKALKTVESASEDEEKSERTTYLQNGRSLAVRADGTEDVVEIKAASGQVELRVRLTEEGPVLSLEGVKLSMRGAEGVDVSCKTFRVDASEGVELASKGEVRVTSEKDATVESTADVRINGKTIWLN